MEKVLVEVPNVNIGYKKAEDFNFFCLYVDDVPVAAVFEDLMEEPFIEVLDIKSAPYHIQKHLNNIYLLLKVEIERFSIMGRLDIEHQYMYIERLLKFLVLLLAYYDDESKESYYGVAFQTDLRIARPLCFKTSDNLESLKTSLLYDEECSYSLDKSFSELAAAFIVNRDSGQVELYKLVEIEE